MVGHQETGAKRANHLHLVAHLQVAHVVGANTAHRLALMVFQHALDGQRQVVVTGPLTVARAGDRVLARMVGAPAGVGAGRDDADRLPLQHRKRQAAKVQHDVVGVVVVPDVGHAHITGHGGGDKLVRGLGAVEVGVGVGGRPGRAGGAVLCRAERRCGGAAGGCRAVGVGRGQRVGRHTRLGQRLGTELGRQLIPGQLLGRRVSPDARHGTPVVDRAGRAGRDAGHAQIALVGIDHVVAIVVRDGSHGADRLAGVAADADFGVDQVLSDHGHGVHVS